MLIRSLSLTLPSVVISMGDGGGIDIASFTIGTVGSSRAGAEPIVNVQAGMPGLYKVLVEEITPRSPSSDLKMLTDWLPFTINDDGGDDALLLTPLLDPKATPDPATDPRPESISMPPGRYELCVEVADQSYRTRSDNLGCALLVAELSVLLAILPMIAAWIMTRTWTPITILAAWAAFSGAMHFIREVRRRQMPPDPPHDYRIAIRPA